MASVRIFVFRKVGPPNVCHMAYEDVDPSEADPLGTRVTGYLGGPATGAQTLEEGDPMFPGCRVVMLSRGDTLIEIWEDADRSSPTNFKGKVIAGYRYVLHSSVSHVLKQGRPS